MGSNKGNVDKYYSDFYSQMIGKDSTGVLSRLWRYPHKLMEKPFKSNVEFRILELGTGEGEHIEFVSDDYSEYIALDLDSSGLRHVAAMAKDRVTPYFGDANPLNFPDATFDRVIATCLLAHLKEPEDALKDMAPSP